MYSDTKIFRDGKPATEEEAQEIRAKMLDDRLKDYHKNRVEITDVLMREGLRFVNRDGQPLHMMPRLKLDPALLEQPLYH